MDLFAWMWVGPMPRSEYTSISLCCLSSVWFEIYRATAWVYATILHSSLTSSIMKVALWAVVKVTRKSRQPNGSTSQIYVFPREPLISKFFCREQSFQTVMGICLDIWPRCPHLTNITPHLHEFFTEFRVWLQSSGFSLERKILFLLALNQQ